MNSLYINVLSAGPGQQSQTTVQGATETHVEGKKTVPLQVHAPPSPSLSVAFCPLLLLLSAFSLPPSLHPQLFVPGTYQAERERRRREGGGVSQHVRRGGERRKTGRE